TFGLAFPSNPSSKGVAQVAETAVKVPLEGVLRFFDCIGPMQIAEAIRTILTGYVKTTSTVHCSGDTSKDLTTPEITRSEI
ncbi:unnamed protein product, partial [Allacma fusca]